MTEPIQPPDTAAPQETPEELRERMRELGRRGAEARWRKHAEAQAGVSADNAPAGDDGGEARKALLAVLRAKDAPHAAVVAAARALLDQEGAQDSAVPTSVAQVEALSTQALHSLITRLTPLASVTLVEDES